MASIKNRLQQLLIIITQISEWREEPDDEKSDKIYEDIKESARKYFDDLEDSIVSKFLFERLIKESKYDYEFINDLENYVLKLSQFYTDNL